MVNTKLTAVLLVSLLAFSACGGDKEEDEVNNTAGDAMDEMSVGASVEEGEKMEEDAMMEEGEAMEEDAMQPEEDEA